MPQMMPIWWLMILLMVTMIFLIMSIFMYYSMIFEHKKTVYKMTIKLI